MGGRDHGARAVRDAPPRRPGRHAAHVRRGVARVRRRARRRDRERARVDVAPLGSSAMWWLWIPLVVLGSILVLLLLLALLGRYKNGALLRPLITRLSRIAFMRRFFQRISTAAIERQNPELASALKKIERVAQNPNPQAVQKAMSRLTPAERRAYMEAAQEQGAVPDSANRQMRRQAERMQQQARGGRPGAGGASSSRKRKRK